MQLNHNNSQMQSIQYNDQLLENKIDKQVQMNKLISPNQPINLKFSRYDKKFPFGVILDVHISIIKKCDHANNCLYRDFLNRNDENYYDICDHGINCKHENKCLIWKGEYKGEHAHFRPFINSKRELFSVQKFIWEFYNKGTIPNDQYIGRTCLNYGCVEYSHFILMSKKNQITQNNTEILKKLFNQNNVEVDGPNKGCRLWKGRKDGDGFGMCTVHGKNMAVSRVVCLLANNMDLKCSTNYIVKRTCKNKHCYEISHLVLIDKNDPYNPINNESAINNINIILNNAQTPLGILTNHQLVDNINNILNNNNSNNTLNNYANNILNSQIDVSDDFDNFDEFDELNDSDNSINYKNEYKSTTTTTTTTTTTSNSILNHTQIIEKNNIRYMGNIKCIDHEQMDQELAQAIKLSKRPMYDINYKTVSQRSDLFNVSKTIIRKIDYEELWKDLEGPLEWKINENDPRAIYPSDFRQILNKIKSNIKESCKLSSDLFEKLNRTPCKIWTHTVASRVSGYGRMKIRGKNFGTHYLVCYIYNGHKPKNYDTRHLCGNGLCCNKHHLTFGTKSQNVLDNYSHGKIKRKISDEQVIILRDAASKQNANVKDVAKYYANEYGVTYEYLLEVIKGRERKHVTNINE